jgi:hypothetical protein
MYFLIAKRCIVKPARKRAKGERGVDGRAADWSGEDGGGVSEMLEKGEGTERSLDVLPVTA